jgi:hypothetical protein
MVRFLGLRGVAMDELSVFTGERESHLRRADGGGG